MEHDFISKRFESKYRQRTFKERYTTWYFLFELVAFLALLYSAVASASFYESIFLGWGMTSNQALYTGLFISGGIAFLIGFGSHHSITYFIENGKLDMIALGVVLPLIGWNIYTDINGAPEVAVKLNSSPPTNTEYAILQSKIDSLDSSKGAIWEKYRWNGNLPSAITPAYKKWGHDVDGDLATLDQIRQERKNVLDLQSIATADFQKAKEKHNLNIERQQGLMKGGVIISTLIYFLLSAWCHWFGLKVCRIKETEQKKEEQLEEVQEEDNKELQTAWATLLSENAELREELRARKEKRNDDFFNNALHEVGETIDLSEGLKESINTSINRGINREGDSYQKHYDFLAKYPKEVEALQAGSTLNEVSKINGLSKSTCQALRRALKLVDLYTTSN